MRPKNPLRLFYLTVCGGLRFRSIGDNRSTIMVEPKPEQPSWRSITKASARGVPRTSSTFLPQCYAKLGDVTTIENTILCYDPKRMLSIKATTFPEGFEFVEAARETWSVFYFAKVSDSKTKITIVGLGYSDSEQSKKMRAFFKPANKYSMDQLKAALEKKAPEKKNDD